MVSEKWSQLIKNVSLRIRSKRMKSSLSLYLLTFLVTTFLMATFLVITLFYHWGVSRVIRWKNFFGKFKDWQKCQMLIELWLDWWSHHFSASPVSVCASPEYDIIHTCIWYYIHICICMCITTWRIEMSPSSFVSILLYISWTKKQIFNLSKGNIFMRYAIK